MNMERPGLKITKEKTAEQTEARLEKMRQDIRGTLAQNNIKGTEKMIDRVVNGLRENGKIEPTRVEMNNYIKQWKDTLLTLQERDDDVPQAENLLAAK